MLKICFVTSNLSEIGGLQRVTSVLVNELAKEELFEISLLFVSHEKVSRKKMYPIENSVKIFYGNRMYRKKQEFIIQKILSKINSKLFKIDNLKLLLESYFPKKEIERYNSFFEDNPQDIIIGIAPRQAGLVSLLDTNSKKIGWFHNTYKRYFKIQNKELWNQNSLYYYLLKKLDKVVVLSNHDKIEYDEKFNIDSIRIYNPISFKSEEKSSLTKNQLLFVGRIFYETKGIDLLLKIMAQVVSENPDIKLNIVGDGPDKYRMLEDIKALNLTENIYYHGSTSNVEEHYLKNSILVLPSTIEGFGLVVTEAMEFGLPVISFQTEGPSEIIQNGTNGFLISNFNIEQFSQKILYLTNNRKELETMGLNATERAKDFSHKRIVNQWKLLFQEMS